MDTSPASRSSKHFLRELRDLLRQIVQDGDCGTQRPNAEYATKQDLAEMERRIMVNFDQLFERVRRVSTVLESLNVLFDGLRTEVQAVLRGDRIPKPTQDKIDALFAEIGANATKAEEVLLENTPAEPPVEPPVGQPPVPPNPPFPPPTP